ncbi:MAG: TolC family protein [Bacteriovoracaceae bacterium]|nr:TolC family protein [Bacteriovoracaceae bacterium]
MIQKIYILALLLGMHSTSFAKVILTYEEAVLLAQKNNLEIAAASEAFRASELKIRSAQGQYLPDLNLGLSYNKIKSELSTGASTSNDSFTSSLTLTQNLFNGFSDAASVKLARSNFLTEEANFQDTKSQISFDLRSAFAAYFYAKDSLTLARDIKKRREDNLAMVELRFENGRENKGSVLLSKAYLEGAKLDLIKAENTMQSSLLYLARILNIGDDTQIELSSRPEIPLMSYDKTNPDFNLLIQDTPLFKKFQSVLLSAEANLTIGRSSYYPSWDISGSVEKSGDSFFPNDTKNLKIGTGLTWSIFNGGKDYFTTNSQNLLVKASEKRLENQYKELKRILQQNFVSFKEASLAVNVSQAFLKAAEVRSDIARSKYNNGISNFDDWDLIENELINRQKDLTLKVRDQLVALASWENAQGKGMFP